MMQLITKAIILIKANQTLCVHCACGIAVERIAGRWRVILWVILVNRRNKVSTNEPVREFLEENERSINEGNCHVYGETRGV